MQNLILFVLGICLLAVDMDAQNSTASPQVSTFTIEAPQLDTIKKIWVYMPKNYRGSNKKYPVIYMHDAQNLFDRTTSFSGEWNVDESLDSISAQVIVIGIEHGNAKRIDELTPYQHPKYGGGNADAYLEFITNTLKPAVDRKYRTKSNKRNTAIMGSSLGGLVSYYAILKYPEVFGKAGIFSPSFWFSEEIYKLTAGKQKIKTKLYFVAGADESAETLPDLERMYELVSQKRCDCLNLSKKVIVKDGQHNEKLWRENFLNAYLWLY